MKDDGFTFTVIMFMLLLIIWQLSKIIDILEALPR